MFLANMQFTVQHVIAKANAAGGFQAGDVWILNDPYVGGTHLPDVNLVSPYFVDGELVAVFANTGHWMDIGGSVAGGWAPKARDIHQEGILIPPVKLYDHGRLNEALVELFKANVRLPDQIAGDLAAMANVFHPARRRMDELVDRYGLRTIRECLDSLIESSERQMRSYIQEIPDGVYSFEDWLDNDGIDDEALYFSLRAEVRGDEMWLDFAGTSPAAAGPMNLSLNTTVSAIYVALKHLYPDVPVNGGTFRPVHTTVPSGSVLAAQYPSPVGGYQEVVSRVLDLVMGALAQAVPEKVPAAAYGTTGVVTLGGIHPETKRFYVGVFPYPGGYGGSLETDGLAHGTLPQSMANFVSLEASEHRYPIRFDYFKLREDSGGAGMHRGGCGTSYGFTALAACQLSILGDRVDHVPVGVAGGKPGTPNQVRLLTGGREWEPLLRSKVDSQALLAGDSVRVSSPGAAGWGDPLDRTVKEVENDLNMGYVSRHTAETEYGVAVSQTTETSGRRRFQADEAASTAERSRRRNLSSYRPIQNSDSATRDSRTVVPAGPPRPGARPAGEGPGPWRC